jgi:non-homologous end joining protein Ku
MVGIGRVVFGSRDHMIALRPRGKGMVGTTLIDPLRGPQRESAQVF